MAEYSEDLNLELIVRFDGSKADFEKTDGEQSKYIAAKTSKVVFITGSTATNATNEQKRQHIWITNGESHKYLDMTNIDDIKDGLTHIAGFAIDGEIKSTATGANGVNFIGKNGISVTLNPTTSTDKNGVPYWTIELNGQGIIDAVMGYSNDSTNIMTLYGVKNYAQAAANTAKNAVVGSDGDSATANTVYGAKAYTDQEVGEARTQLVGDDNKDSAASDSIVGAKKYADEVAGDKADAAKKDAIQAAKDYVDPLLVNKADLENGKIKESQLPDYIFGQMLFGGTITSGSANDMVVSPSTKLLDKINNTSSPTSLTIQKTQSSTYEGAYFIVTGDNITSVFGFSVVVGDWIVSTGSEWQKVDNTDALTSVAGITPTNGTISATDLAKKLSETGDANELALKSEVDSKYSKPSAGIPSTDLSSDVQESLRRANTSISGISSGTPNYIGTGTDGTTGAASISANVTDLGEVQAETLLGNATGLASAEDVYNYIKARLSVKVIS